MVSVAAFRKLALSLPDAAEGPHFENTAFLVKGKIFATLNTGTGRAVVKLLAEQQEVMTTAEPAIAGYRASRGHANSSPQRIHLNHRARLSCAIRWIFPSR